MIVSKTRDFFPKDFDFPVKNLIQKFGKLINYRLTSINPKTGKSIHIVLRVVRPHSNDYNPPHKDIYEAYDRVMVYLNF